MENTEIISKYRKLPYSRRVGIAAAIRRAMKKIEGRGHWIEGTEAQDKDGNEVSPKSNDAVAFCAIGSLHATAGGYFEDARRLVNSSVEGNYCNHTGGRCDCMVSVNDEEGKDAVKKLFTRAIKNLNVKEDDLDKLA